MKNFFTRVGCVFWAATMCSLGAYGQVNVEWDKTYGGDRQDQLTDIIRTADGGYLLGGSSNSSASFEKSDDPYEHFFYTDYWIVKTDASGSILWDKTIGGNHYDDLTTLTLMADGGFLIGGSSTSAASGDKTEDAGEIDGYSWSDFWMVRTDADGNILWDKTIGGNGFETLQEVLSTSDGGFLLAGYSSSDASGDKTEDSQGKSDMWLVKIDAQGNILWDKTIGTTASEILNAMLPTDDGGFLLGGSRQHESCDPTEPPGGHYYDFWIVKVDASGTQQWDKTYGGCGADVLKDMALAADGGFLLGGHSSSEASGDKTDNARGYDDYWVVRIDGQGNQLWDKTYGGSGFDNLTVLEAVKDGGFLLGGYSFSQVSGDKTASPIGYPLSDFWLVRIDEEGIKQWDETLGGTHYEHLSSILLTDEGYVLAGHSSSNASGNKSEDTRGGDDYWVVEITEEGRGNPPPAPAPDELAIEWDATFGSSGSENAAAIVATPDGGFLVGGSTSGNASGDKSEDARGGLGRSDYWVVRMDAEGNKLWDRTFGGDVYDDLRDIVATDDGGYLLGGFSHSGTSYDRTSPTKGNGDYWIVKIDDAGNKLWDKGYGGSGNDYLFDMIATPDGGFLLGGASASPASLDKSQDPIVEGVEDFWVVKIDAEGNINWERRFGGNSIDHIYTMTVAADGGYLLGGYTQSDASGDKTEESRGFSDFWMVKVDQDGNKEWDKTLGGSGEDLMYGAAATDDGGFLVGGGSDSNISGDKTENSRGENDYWLVRLDASGQVLWDRTYGGSGTESLGLIEHAPGGGFLLGGSSHSNASRDKAEDSRGSTDFWIIRIDESGNQRWNKTIGGSEADGLADMTAAVGGGFVLAGSSQSPSSGEKTEDNKSELPQWYDYWVVKIGVEGDTGGTPDPAPQPTAGHITGGGVFTSPAGAYAPEPTAQGRAAFSISVQHKKGEEAPKGNVTFLLSAARLIFHSQSIDWLSVDEDQAFIKGRGRIGRAEGYHFLLSVVDHGQPDQQQGDYFRMMIWDEEGYVVYDSEREAPRFGGAGMAILAGNITIHGQKGNHHSISAREQEDAQLNEWRQGFKAYPTKFSQQGLWLEIPASNEARQLQVTILDSQGRKMATTSFKTGAQAGRQLWKLDHHAWGTGIYLLIIEGVQLNHQQKLVK